MKHLIIIFAVLASFNITNAQSTASPTNVDGAGLIGQYMTTKVTAAKEPENIQGSKYLSEQFLPIKIFNQKEDKRFLAKYNAFTGNMEVKEMDSKTDDFYVLSKDINDISLEFTTSGELYQTYEYVNEDNESKKDFFVNLVKTNRVSLLKKQEVKFEPAKPAKSSYEKSRPAKYERQKDEYYIKIGAEKAMPLPSNKNDIAELFPKYEKEIKTFIKKNRIKTSKEEDLISLVKYINQL
ncbi:hypothetical protein [Winogradskyella ursingii]|uniref:hypothetical protein n=1 Tax=Winogradskyella ursingii TaxID=2686079 RepID=UPI0015CD3A62|nr:hypothetical protein [Winogradskyella ursingii]